MQWQTTSSTESLAGKVGGKPDGLVCVSPPTTTTPSHRVADNCDQLTQINNRILTSQAKIDKLRSASTKAARVFSSPKYPAPESITDYHTIYQDVNPLLHRVRVQGVWL